MRQSLPHCNPLALIFGKTYCDGKSRKGHVPDSFPGPFPLIDQLRGAGRRAKAPAIIQPIWARSPTGAVARHCNVNHLDKNSSTLAGSGSAELWVFYFPYPIPQSFPCALPAQCNAGKRASVVRRCQIFNLPRLPFALRVILSLDLADECNAPRNDYVRRAGCKPFSLLLDHAFVLTAS